MFVPDSDRFSEKPLAVVWYSFYGINFVPPVTESFEETMFIACRYALLAYNNVETIARTTTVYSILA